MYDLGGVYLTPQNGLVFQMFPSLAAVKLGFKVLLSMPVEFHCS
jgi:hypothetical protein